jgi:Na+-transporting NADH:ubiquinone oxidoreductase subunit NqrC
MSNDFIPQTKRFLKICLIVLITGLILAGILTGIFYYLKSKKQVIKTEEKTIEKQAEITEKPAEILKQDNTSETLRLQEMQRIEFEKAIVELKSIKLSSTQTDYAPLLISLNILENKFNTGGEIANDVIKLKAFGNTIPEIRVIVSKFENIKNIISAEKLKYSFADYVKAVKADEIASQNTKLATITASIAKYFTILNASNSRDALLIEMKAHLNENNFIAALEIAEKINLKNTDTQDFLLNLEKFAKIQEGINEIYFFVSQNLSK